MLLVVNLCRRPSLHDEVPCYWKVAQTQCSRPYDTLTCYFHTAVWLGKCQSILTQTQHSSELGMGCYRASPFCTSTCCVPRVAVGSWSFTVERGCKLGSPWKRSSRSSTTALATMLNHQKFCETTWPEIHVPTFPDGGFRCTSWNTRGLLGSPASSQRSRER